MKNVDASIRIVHALLLGAAGVPGLSCASAHAGGFLWMGSEFAAEGTVYRYSIDAGVIDLALTPALPAGGSHFNNMACDGTTLYIGTPTTQYVGMLDAQTGAFLGSTTYSPTLSGHKEDGAVHSGTGHVWRITFSNLLHETTSDGALVNTYSGVGALVGAEWVGDTLYATNYSGGSIGRIDFPGGLAATFVPIPWAAGGAPSALTLGALAYDCADSILYLVTYNDQRLWSITFNGNTATATLVVDLNDVGMAAGVLVDGMGWSGRCDNSCPADLTGDGVVDGADLGILLGDWNAPGGPADLNDDGIVNGADLGIMLGAWGPCPA